MSKGAQFVGRDARCPELRMAGYYEVMMGYVDWLLPVQEEIEA